MSGAGAPEEAVKFSRRLVRQYPGEVGTMLAIKNVGYADLASVQYLMRAGNNVGLLLVNRASPNPDVNDPTDIDKSAMEAEAWYVRLKQQFPNLYLGSSRPRKAWLRVARQPDGALEYTDSYALNDGRNDRNNLMCFAAFAWDFDAQGRFRDTHYLSGGPAIID